MIASEKLALLLPRSLFPLGGHFFHLETKPSSILLIGETEPAALSFNGQSDAKEDQDQGVGQESNGEGTSNQLPSDGSKDGSDDSTKEFRRRHQSPKDWANHAFNTAAILCQYEDIYNFIARRMASF